LPSIVANLMIMANFLVTRGSGNALSDAKLIETRQLRSSLSTWMNQLNNGKRLAVPYRINIAFIKYWGDRDATLRLPSNGSISMNLDGLYTRSQVVFDDDLKKDTLSINALPIAGPGLSRVSACWTGAPWRHEACAPGLPVRITSPSGGAGLHRQPFAALSLAASAAAGLQLDEKDLSRLARTGSGSACRSVPGGYVEWQAGESDADSYAFSIAPPDHWDLVDCIAIVSQAHKPTGSMEGHARAHTSVLQAARQAE
jgi:diphosphomevalonate decarboxylase